MTISDELQTCIAELRDARSQKAIAKAGLARATAKYEAAARAEHDAEKNFRSSIEREFMGDR